MSNIALQPSIGHFQTFLDGLASGDVDGGLESFLEIVLYFIFLETNGGTPSAWWMETLVYSSRSFSDEFFCLFPSRLFDLVSDSDSATIVSVSSKTPHGSYYFFKTMNYNFVDDLFLYKGISGVKAFGSGGSIAYGTIEASKVGLVVQLLVIVS